MTADGRPIQRFCAVRFQIAQRECVHPTQPKRIDCVSFSINYLEMQSTLRFFSLLVSLFFVFAVNAQSEESCTSDGDPQQLFQPVGNQRLGEWAAEVDDLQALQINAQVFDYLRTYKFNELIFELPIGENETVTVEAELFVPWKSDFQYGTTLPNGDFEKVDYTPQLLCYRLRAPQFKGTLILMADHVIGTFAYNRKQYEISAVKDGAEGLYAIVPTDSGLFPEGFSCGVDDSAYELSHRTSHRAAGGGGCVELAVDIDFHTFEAFGSDCATNIEWTLALIAGVNDIYVNDLNALINIEATYIHIWQTEDPYAAFVEEAGDMLDAFRQEWLDNPNLSVIDRDLVHLLSRRTNTGTGGIAYLGVNCSNNFGAGFSSYLTPQTTYNLSNYAWNLDVVAHELGHNFGSPHTHWCGWSVGTIDDCAEAEGDCTNEVQAQVGTIMSYCHTIQGGSKVLEFHPIVIDEALVPDITSFGDCYTDCAELSTSCLYFGCTDPLACNFEPEAEADDNTCFYGEDCTDPTACNFDPNSVCEGPCSYTSGCTDPGACNYDAAAGCDDGSCIQPDGCTDPEACNFAANAICDDGSCAYINAFNVLGPTIAMNSEPYTYIYAQSAGSTYTWSATGGEVISGQGSNAVEVSWFPGEEVYSLCVVEETNLGCISEEVCLSVDVLTVGIDDLNGTAFTVYPNPGDGNFTLALEEAHLGRQLQVFDAQGRLVRELTLNATLQPVDLRAFANGTYYLMIQGERPLVQQVIKQ
jgi:hypothetical protein